MRDQLVLSLRTVSPDYAEHLRKIEGNPYKDLCEVFDALKAEQKKVLLLLDGFDKPLANGRLTRNLWDELRELASYPSIRLVTASRRRLHDLIRSTDSQTSDFWNIFDPTPVRVDCFDKNDIAEAISQLSGITLNQGAQKELQNWTGGFLEHHLDTSEKDIGSLGRFFGSPEAFRINARQLLERRLAHLDRLDAKLKRYIERGIEDIPDHPEVCLSNIRGIVDQALDLIWASELGADRKIPSD